MKNWMKYTIAFLVALIIRLVPFRAPNVEPIMAVIMPFGKKYNIFSIFMFSVFSIVLFDFVTSGIGIWTLITAFIYGLIGIGASFYFKNRSGWRNYALYAFFATIVYDCLTGLTIGPLFFNQSFMVSLIGQIPFTILHLIGNVSFAIVLSPVIERWVIKESVKTIEVESRVLVG
jgi:energy-coupling factor transport system substrate-specific component